MCSQNLTRRKAIRLGTDWSCLGFMGLLLIGMTCLLLTVFAEEGKIPVPPSILMVGGLLAEWPMVAVGVSTVLYVFCVAVVWVFAKRKAPNCDPVIYIIGAMLAGVGYILLIRLSPDIALARHRVGLSLLAGKQFNYLLVSLFAFWGGLWGADPKILQKLARRRYWFVVLAIVLIAVTGLFGQEINNRRLWLPLGPVQFQTVELVKVFVILFAASFFADCGEPLVGGRPPARWPGFRLQVVGPFVFTALLFLLPIVLQGDLGPALLLSLFMLVMFYVSGNGMLWPLMGVAMLCCVSCAAYHWGWPSMVRIRFDMWLDPFHHSEVLSQSLWALQSGGMLGAGLGFGWSARIPVVQSDFNFTVLVEEFGWIGGVAIVSLYLLLLYRGLKVASFQRNDYVRYVVIGILCVFVIQVLLIVGGNMAVLPLTGITLPFVSYGGSSLLVSFFLLGVLARCSGRMQE